MNNPEIKLRSALENDVPGIIECVENAYHHYIDRIGKKPGPMLDDYAEAISIHEVYVAEEADRIAGILVLIKQDNTLLLDNVAVHNDFQRRGIGRKLMSLAEQRARQLGYSNIELYTHELMTENYQAYLKLGYMEVDRRTVKGYDRIYMLKNLAD